MAQRRERAVGIHPFAKVGQDLLSGLVPEEGFQLRPVAGMRLADEGKRGLREDCPVGIEPFASDRHIAVVQKVGLDDRLEGGFARSRHSVHSEYEGDRRGRRMIDRKSATAQRPCGLALVR